MPNVLSVYLSNHHDWQSTFDYIGALDPAWVNIHQPTARDIQRVQQVAPNAKVMLRSWDIDDHNGDRKRELYADPKGAARKHLEMWKAKWDELTLELSRNNWRTDEGNWYIGLVNEPDPAYVPQIVEYSLEAMRLVSGTSIHLGLVASSVGTFAKPSEGDHGWTQFIPLEKPINDGRHILLVHEYWQPEGPSFVWEQNGVQKHDAGNLAWRHHSIPLNVPILIRECGANGYIYGRHSQTDDAGWQKFMAAPTFADQTHEYIEGCDGRVKGACLYMTDYHDKQWRTFDTTPAHEYLLKIRHVRPTVASPFANKPLDTHLPIIGTGPQPAQPTKPASNAPPRDIDPRATQRGVSVVEIAPKPGETCWRAVKVQWLDEQQAQGRHHIYVDLLDEAGNRVVGVPLLVTWPTGNTRIVTEAKPGEPYAANFPMSPSRNEFSVAVVDGTPSEMVRGIGMGADTPGGFNAGIHTSTAVVFRRMKVPAATEQKPVPQPAQPTGPTAIVSVPAGANIRTGPGLDYPIRGAEPYGAAMPVAGRDESGQWWYVDMPHAAGWVSATVVDARNVAHVPVRNDVLEPQPQSDKWQRSLAFTARWEGGYQNVANDAGNWTGGAVGVGELKGTNFGISAASYPHLDIKNLTREQANEIYRRDYWQASGADQLAWPACLLVFDTAVLHGVDTAKTWLKEVGPNPHLFAAKRLRVYIKRSNWDFWGKAWTQRVADLLEEMGEP